MPSNNNMLDLPPLRERLAAGRPLFTREQAQALSKKVLSLVTSRTQRLTVEVTHSVRSMNRIVRGQVRSAEEGELLSIQLQTSYSPAFVMLTTNQLDDEGLNTLISRVNTIMNAMTFQLEPLAVMQEDVQDSYLPVRLWYDSTVDAMRSARETAIPKIVDTVQRQSGNGGPFNASGFVGLIAKASAVLTGRGITAFSEETDSEINVTARPADGSVSGWSGQAARDWTVLDPIRVASEAADLAAKSVGLSAIEPGRRTAILTPAAVAQLMRFVAPQFDGKGSDLGGTAFSKVPNEHMGSRWGQRMFDSRVQISIDPADPDGGYCPWYADGYANPTMTLIERGTLKNLCYKWPGDALSIGKPYADIPYGFRLHGGTTSINEMVAQCEEGILVNRVSSVDLLDMHTGMMTGVTRDGCFLIKNGKINRPVKNFRFLTSPFFFLNQLVALGPTQRAAFGYSPPTNMELLITSQSYRETGVYDWPRRPMIVPPMMVNDFNFNAMVDAV